MTTLRHGTANSDGCIESKIAFQYVKQRVMILKGGLGTRRLDGRSISLVMKYLDH